MPRVFVLNVICTNVNYTVDLPFFIKFTKVRISHVEYTNKSNALYPSQSGPYRAMAIKLNTYNTNYLDQGTGYNLTEALKHVFLVKNVDTTTIYTSISDVVYDYQSNEEEEAKTLYFSFIMDTQTNSIDISPSNPVTMTVEFFA